jgi:hypothetical protein
MVYRYKNRIQIVVHTLLAYSNKMFVCLILVRNQAILRYILKLPGTGDDSFRQF